MLQGEPLSGHLLTTIIDQERHVNEGVLANDC